MKVKPKMTTDTAKKVLQESEEWVGKEANALKVAVVTDISEVRAFLNHLRERMLRTHKWTEEDEVRFKSL